MNGPLGENHIARSVNETQSVMELWQDNVTEITEATEADYSSFVLRNC